MQEREPPLLRRLRQAVRASGLHVDVQAIDGDARALVVTSRVVQTSVRYLTRIEPAAAQRLTEELRELGGSDFDLLMQDRGFTFFHVVQFINEWIKANAAHPDREFFSDAMGHGGGGVEVQPEVEVASLLQLLVSAIPPGNDAPHLGAVMGHVGPLILGSVFSESLFRLQVEPSGDLGMRLSLEYADPAGLRRALAAYDLQEDAGVFFTNSALHIQGTARLGWNTFAIDARHKVRMSPVIQELPLPERQAIQQDCRCTWEVSWTPDVRLRRLPSAAEALARTQDVYQALRRKDLEYYLERIRSLEVQVQSLEHGDRFHDLVGHSRRMHQLFQLIEQVSGSDLTVLVRGESGTGKELIARSIHQASPRRDRPFVPVNCAAFAETLLESELFGYERGAFTGADRDKMGRFELADGGTLFLDEVGDIPLTTQVKLLRALESRTFERVGGTRSLSVDVRIVAATNRDLEALIAGGDFREDLYFRLNVIPVVAPPLREHAEDIPQLAHLFLRQLAERAGVEPKGLARGAVDRLVGYSWPGNIRELRNVIERAAAVYAEGPVLREGDIMRALGVQLEPGVPADLNHRQQRLLATLKEAGAGDIDYLLQPLTATGVEGASRRSLQNDLRRLTELGYTTWQKHGSRRVYRLTREGEGRLAEL
jgi:DNA-binding NtrC family response regulator